MALYVDFSDPFCPIDYAAFAKECRVPLFPGKVNTWRVIVSDRVKKEPIKAVKDALRVWFRESAELPGVTTGMAENVTIQRASAGLLSGRKLAASRDGCTLPLAVPVDKTSTMLVVQFVWRGAAPDLPWPAFRSGLYDTTCPVDAEILLDAAFEPRAGEPVPDPETPFDILPDDVLEAGKTVGKGLLIAAGVVAGLLLLARQ